MHSCAITDHGVMYGVIDFYKACKAEGIKAIIGCEVYVAPNSRFDKGVGVSEERYNHLVLLAENNIGYKNLMKIVSLGFIEGFYYKPRVDYEILEEYKEGIIAISACLAGEISRNIRRGFYDEAKKSALQLQEVFGKDNFYLELQDHGMTEQTTVNQGMLKLSQDTGIELVATNDVHYIYAEDSVAHDILLCIQTQKKRSDENRMRYDGGQYYLKSPEEMKTLFPYALDALENTNKIAKRCNVTINFGEYILPTYPVPEAYTAWEYLKNLCYEGLRNNYKEITIDLTNRLEFELETIKNMGFIDYFLIVWDFIKYAKDNNIIVGPGRGSAAGSIVSYCLNITTVDPIKYNLLFERFLNPERLTMPDIDIDFCFVRRQEVIDYVTQKYGKDKVAQIVTFGTLAARAAIRDVGRAIDLPYAKVDQIAKMIPTEIGINIEKALKSNNELAKAYHDDEDVKHLIDMSKRLEGLPRHTSMHAAGVVISRDNINEYVPLTVSSDNTITTQFPMTTLEELGLLKMDFLGLRTLTVIKNAVDLINNDSKYKEKIDIDNIDFNKKAVYDLIASGKTDGVFQLESAGMKSFMKELKPETLEDVIAGIALYRPGPMDFIPKYISGKNESDSIVYDCPELEPILSTTYGCIVYQEQVMQIVRELAGYSYGRSDILRRAMSKKHSDVMGQERHNFVYGNEKENVKGCVNNGISESVANHIYDEMMDFAKYAFNKSHAAAYAIISYQTAYLKTYYPVEFMAALITSVIDNSTKVAEYIYSCRQMDIKILPPDINDGFSTFTVSGNSIRYSLSAIKGVGKSVIDAIVEERRIGGKFDSLTDFATRLSGKEVNKRTIESFIKAGAFSSIHSNRRQLMMSYIQILDQVNTAKKSSMSGQITLFDIVSDELKEEFNFVMPDVSEYSKEEILVFEKEVLGIYISGHPLEEYEYIIQKNTTTNSLAFSADQENDDKPKLVDGASHRIGGMITGITVKTTRNGQLMAFVMLEDLFGLVEVIIFPRDYEKNKVHLVEDNKILIQGRVTTDEDRGNKLICQSITPFKNIPRELWIRYKNNEEFNLDKDRLLELIQKFEQGNDNLKIYLEEEKKVEYFKKCNKIKINKELIELLNRNYLKDNIKVR